MLGGNCVTLMGGTVPPAEATLRLACAAVIDGNMDA